MKKAFAIVISSIAFLIISNIYYYQDTYSWQLNTQKSILEKQLTSCNKEINSFLTEIETNVLLLLTEKELGSLFSFKLESDEIQKRIELLYNRYGNTLNQLKVYDTRGNFYSITKRSNNPIITRYGKENRKEAFSRTIYFSSDYKSIVVNQPIYCSTHIFGYIVFHINTSLFFNQIFKGFNLEGHQFQWISDKNNKLIFTTHPNLELTDNNVTFISKGETSSYTHILNINNQETKTLTVSKILKISNKRYTMAFSLPINPITHSILKNSLFVALITFMIIIVIAVAFHHNIIKNKTSQERLAQSEEALRKILYFAPVGIVLEDTNNRIKLVNKAALKIFDCDDEDMLLGQVCDDKILFERKRTIESQSVSKSSKKLVFNADSKSRQVILSERIPFFNQNQKYYINNYIEITPLELNNKQLNKRSAQTTFVANISHELRTPLNAIIGMTDIMLPSTNIQFTEKEMLKVVKRSADTLLALINDILDFSKIEAGKLEIESIPVNIGTEIKNTISDFKTLSKERSVKLSWDSHIKVPENLLTDPLRFRQILSNLIGNALKFTPAGKVHVQISKASLFNGNPAIKFTISDTGIGIRKEKLNAIFNSFAQEDESTTRKFGGTGLGTSISKNLVHLMGGEIWADSPSSISTTPKYPGAEFCFTLPLITKHKNKNVNYSNILYWSQINALIITDDFLQTQNMSKNLAALGINNRVMAPSLETVLIIKEPDPTHLIIIDQRPDFRGIDFLQQLYNHNIQNNQLILLQSSDYESMNTNLGRKLGADAYLRKPVKLETLRNLLLKHFTSIKEQNSLIGKVVADNIKILVAEDNFFNQKVAQSLFRKIGYQIDIANNGQEAVDKFKANKYDVVFMDLTMPELDGFDATKELKKHNKNCPIIAMTANNDDSQKEKAFNVGMDDFIVKPAQKEEISRMLIKWCSL